MAETNSFVEKKSSMMLEQEMSQLADIEMEKFSNELSDNWMQALDISKQAMRKSVDSMRQQFGLEIVALNSLIDQQENKIAELQETIMKHNLEKGGLGKSMDIVREKLARTFGTGKNATKTKMLHIKIFLHWNSYTKSKVEKKKITHFAQNTYCKSLKTKVLKAWMSVSSLSSRDREKRRVEALLKRTAEEIVERYDERVESLEAQLVRAQHEITEGHRRRQHLEDELRRTLLKGINAMNLDALNIFQSASMVDNAHAAPCGIDTSSHHQSSSNPLANDLAISQEAWMQEPTAGSMKSIPRPVSISSNTVEFIKSSSSGPSPVQSYQMKQKENLKGSGSTARSPASVNTISSAKLSSPRPPTSSRYSPHGSTSNEPPRPRSAVPRPTPPLVERHMK